jgi:endonuclease V-like protein UPF0215 family
MIVMKDQIRVLGIDDSPFQFEDERVRIVGILMRTPAYIEGVLSSWVEVDGTDATQALVEMINGSRFKDQVKMVMLDGISLGGFNVLDIHRISRDTGIPVATITRDAPDRGAMEQALRKHFDDWENRLALIRKVELVEVETGHHTIHVGLAGISLQDFQEISKKNTVRGAVPEALRVAHLIASGIATGESSGRA